MKEEASVDRKRYPLAVVIPTYNRADVLLECLKHLEDQTHKDFEVVIVDDGSTDSTPDQMQAYLRNTPLAVRYIRQENRGPARARNHAISIIESPISLMIGDDIFASPVLIDEHLQLHRKHPEESVGGLGLTRWSEKDQAVTPFMRWLDRGDGLQFHYDLLLAGKTPDWAEFWTSNISLKTKVLKEFPFDESFPHAAMEDIELACRIEARHGLKLVFLREALAHHFHPTSFMQACRRMVKVGESSAYFDRLWPGKIPRKRNVLKRPLQSILLAFPSAWPAWVKLADWSLKVACPNSLMRYVLSCHFAMATIGSGKALRDGSVTKTSTVFKSDGNKLRRYISDGFQRLGRLNLRLYMLVVARPSMRWFNDWLFRIATTGGGYNHCGSVAITGEAILIKLLAQRESSVCIDVGANIGHYSEALLTMTNANVVAFEPLPKAFEALRALAQKFPSRLQIVNKGVGNLNGELNLHYGAEDSELASFSEEVKQIEYVNDENKNSMKVPVVTLDSFFEDPRNADIHHIDLLKIDTEGYEFEVLSGAADTLSRLKPCFIQIEYNWHQLFKGQSLFSIASLLDNYVAYQLLPYGSGLCKVDVRLPQSNIYQYANFVFVRSDISAALAL